MVNTTNTSYTFTGLNPSTNYKITVQAVDVSGNISTGVFVNTSTIAAPADTTVPVLTMTPSQTFTDTLTVNMSTNETSTIWYTLDDTDPITSGTKIEYTAPLTLTETDTIKAYAVDSAGNESAVQTVTYTKEVAETYLYMDGVNSYLKTPSITFNKVIMDMHPMQHTTGNQVYVDARAGVSFGYVLRNTTANNDQSGTGTVKINGAAVAYNTLFVPNDTRSTLEWSLASAGTDDVNIFSDQNNSFRLKGNIYDVKFYNGASLVAHYDMSTGTVNDQTGNGKHATLVGGTFI